MRIIITLDDKVYEDIMSNFSYENHGDLLFDAVASGDIVSTSESFKVTKIPAYICPICNNAVSIPDELKKDKIVYCPFCKVECKEEKNE